MQVEHGGSQPMRSVTSVAAVITEMIKHTTREQSPGRSVSHELGGEWSLHGEADPGSPAVTLERQLSSEERGGVSRGRRQCVV